MRIIAGEARSMPLQAPKGRAVRPTTDKIKETLFNIINFDLPGCTFLDMFAGTGQIGLEALSRGAKFAVFLDNSGESVGYIKKNVEFTGYTEKSLILRADALSAIRRLEGRFVFDIIYIDPPYDMGLETMALSALSGSSVCGEDTSVILEVSDKFDTKSLENTGFYIKRIKEYKTNKHIFLGKA